MNDTDQFKRNMVVVRGEVATMVNRNRIVIDWVAFEREAELDRLHGPRLGPDRFILWEIERPARMVANLRWNLGNGHPAGSVRR